MPSLSWRKLVRKLSRSLGITTPVHEHEAPKRKGKQFQRARLETLEERMLLTTIDYTVDLANYGSNPGGLLDGDVDLTLRIADGGNGTAVLELVDMDRAPGGQVVGSAPFTEPIQINITGYQTTVQGIVEEFPESLVIDWTNSTPYTPAPVDIGINFDGIKGTAVPLLQDDVVTITSGASGYSPANLSVTLANGEKISVTGPLSATGNVTLTSNDGALVEVVGGGSIVAGGDVTLAANATVQADGDADSPDALALPSAAIVVNGGAISGNNITLSATATSNVTIAATDLRDGQFSVGGVINDSSATISITGSSTITASGTLSVAATSTVTTTVTRGTEDDGNANDDDKDQDAAIAASVVTSDASVQIGGTSVLSAVGSASISATNLVNVTTTADGTLGKGGAGGTLATATVLGDTEVLVQDTASITAGGDLSLLASSSRTVATTAKAAPGGATDDDDPNTTTQGQQALDDNNASTADGDMTLAAAISVATVFGETRARVTGGSLTSTGGSIGISSLANHNISTVADGTSATGQQDTGVGVAVAIGLAGVTDPNGATGLRSTAAVSGPVTLNASAINIQATMPESIFKTEATSGPSGPSEDENGEATGADVGVAGALAIGVTITDTSAVADPQANVTVNGSDVQLIALSTTTSLAQAVPHENAVSGESLGIGASVAVHATDHTTRAAIDNGATLTGANDVALTASSNQNVATMAEAGAAGGTAIAAAVALGIANHDTIAEIGTGPALTASGNLSAAATHSGFINTKSQGAAEGTDDAAVGAAFALGYLQDSTQAEINRNVSAGGTVSVQSKQKSNPVTTAHASAVGSAGEDPNGGGNQSDVNTQSGNQRAAGQTQASSRGARGTGGTQNPDASTSDGPITVAAAIALNVASTISSSAIGSGVTVNAGGPIQVSSSANTDASAIADGSATQGDSGIGAAVALNLVNVTNVATIDNGASVSADGITIQATTGGLFADSVHTIKAEATSGAGASSVGIAGSFAVNAANVRTEADVQSGATVTLADGNDPGGSVGLTKLEAVSNTVSSAKALAAESGEADSDLGIGASVAIHISNHDTRSEIEDTAQLAGAHDLTIHAKSDHDVITEAQGGAAGGGVVLTPVVALGFAFHTTEAQIGADNASLDVTGTLNVTAEHTGLMDTDATGNATAEDAAIGASLALTYIEHNVTATTARSLSSGAASSFIAQSTTEHTTDAKASASGAQGDTSDSNGNGGTGQSVQGQVDDQRGLGNSQATANSNKSSGSDNKATATTADGKDQDSQGDAVTVAAAVAVSIVKTTAVAEIADGVSVNSGASLNVQSFQNSDAHAVADGTATDGDVGIGAAVAINVIDVGNHARIGNAAVTADGLVVQAQMTDAADEATDTHSSLAQAKSGAGGDDVGVAGSLAVNHSAVKTSAVIASGASITMADGPDAGSGVGPVSIQSVSATGNTSSALPAVLPQQDGTSDVGVGASVALNLVYHDTSATVEDGVAWSGGPAGSLTVSASADQTMTTEAQNGGKAKDVGVGGAVAVVVAKNNTLASVGSGTGAIQTTGAAAITADHTSTTETSVGAAASGEDAAIGASVGINLVTETVTAEVARHLTAGGNVAVDATSHATATLVVKASAGGGDSSGDDADTESSKQANQSNATSDGSNSVASVSDSTNDANGQSDSQSSSSGGGVGIAAAVAVNVLSLHNTAAISNGADVSAGGSVEISAEQHVVASL